MVTQALEGPHMFTPCHGNGLGNYTGQDSLPEAVDDVAMKGYLPIFYAINGIICVPTVVGNVLVLLCIKQCRHYQSGSLHILIGNLAVSDLVVGAVLIPYCVAIGALDLNSNKYFCLTKASLLVFSVGGTCYGLLLVSVDRFSAICFPFGHRERFSPKRVGIALAIGWCYVGLFAFLPLSGWNFYDINSPYNCLTDRVLTPIYQKMMNVQFMLGLLINLILYIVVIRIAVRNANRIYTISSICDYRKNARELYKIKTMAMVQGLFAVCWFPFVVLAVAIMFSDNRTLRMIQYWSIVPGLLNSAFNWLIYGYRNKVLRQRMKLYIKCKCRS